MRKFGATLIAGTVIAFMAFAPGLSASALEFEGNPSGYGSSPYCVDDPAGSKLYFNNSNGCTYSPGATNLTLYSPNRSYQMVFQGDGNLVVYGPSGAVWSSVTRSTSTNRIVFQSDGNVVIYTSANYPLWQAGSREAGDVGYYIAMQDDGNLVVYGYGGYYLDSRNTYAIWSSQYGHV